MQMLAPPGGSGHSCGSTNTSHVMSHCPQNLCLDSGTLLFCVLFACVDVVFECSCRLRKSSSCMDAHRGVFSCFEH